MDVLKGDDVKDRYFSPEAIASALSKLGAQVGAEYNETADLFDQKEDPRLELVERLMRYFQRSTAINDTLLRKKFGVDWNQFEDEVLEEIRNAGLIKEVAYKGAGKKRRFSLAVGFDDVEKAREQSRGVFEDFLASIRKLSNR